MRKILLLCFLCKTFVGAAQKNIPAGISQKAYTLMRFMDKNHYQPLLWNDSASVMLYNKWLGKLDEEKLFLTQKDIAVLESFKTKLDNELLEKKADFFTTSAAIYKTQLKKTDSILQVIFAKPFDFSKPDNIEWPFAGYAANDAELALRWQKYLKWHLLSRIADNVSADSMALKTTAPADFAAQEIKQRQLIKKQEVSYIKNLLTTPQVFIEDLENEYLNSIAWCYDPHSNYMNMGEKKEFETELSGSEYSVGFDVEENDKGDKIIGYLQPGGSAWRSGNLHKGDVLQKVKINEVEKEVEDIPATELQNIIKGNSETDVEVTVKTATGEQKKVKLSKEKITNEEGIVKSYVLHGSKNVGYINLPGFYSRENENAKKEADLTFDGCANDVSKEIVKLKKDTIAGLILDLRFNGGGSMWEAMQLAGIFIDIGPVASVKDRTAKVHFLKDPNRGTIYDGPLLVLINGASASASEFTSAVLQDYNRAVIVGGITYGKGTAQVVMPMDTNSIAPNKNATDFVKVTTEKFYRVNGSTTQWKGVVPDIILPDLYADDIYKEKANKSALKPDDSKTGMYDALQPLPIQALQAKSMQRISANSFFKSITDFNGWMVNYRKGRSIPLQWNTYAVHYNKSKEMFGSLKDEDDTTVKNTTDITATNNAFDRQRINTAAAKTKEINDVYLKHIENDQTLAEAFSIMLDFSSK